MRRFRGEDVDLRSRSKALMALLPPDSLGFGDPSPAALETLNQLEQALDDDVPRRSPDNLLIATWNIKALARVTKR